VTFVDPAVGRIYGCDSTDLSGQEPYCGFVVGTFENGKPTDPRLSFWCSENSPIAFVWVSPTSQAEWVAIDQGDFLEVFPVAQGLPVRIGTRAGISIQGSSIKLEVIEIAADGSEISRTPLEATVAG